MSNLIVRQEKIQPKGKQIFELCNRNIVHLTLMAEPISRTAERKNSGNASNCGADDDACNNFPEPKIVNEKKFNCIYCGKKYRTKYGLERHIEDHGEHALIFSVSL